MQNDTPNDTTPPAGTQKAAKEARQAALIASCYKYYLKDLTAAEIALLVGYSLRTVQRIIADNDFPGKARPADRAGKVIAMQKTGLCPAAIARALSLSRTTVYKYLNAPPAE